MILETYQEEQALVQPDPSGQCFATVGTVYEDGITLLFNGAETESLKHYKCNACVRFAAGQRVRILEDSGTYVVEYPIGAPTASVYADSAGQAAYASEAGHADTAARAATATKAETATTAGSADTAKSAEAAAAAKTAETAKSADTAAFAVEAESATRAMRVDNQAAGIADLLFYYSTQGVIFVRATADSRWTKLTGTVVNSV